MISPYSEIINYEEDNWQEFLERVCLIDIFMPVIKSYQDLNTLKCVIRYIVYAYSQSSDKIVLGMEWQKNKQLIFEFVLAKPEKSIYEDLVLLKNTAVVEAIHKWLDFNDRDVFTQMQVLKDLRLEMQLSCVTDIKNASGEINYDQKYRNAEYAVKLKDKIKELEQEVIQNNVKMKDAVREVKTTKSKSTIGPESFSK